MKFFAGLLTGCILATILSGTAFNSLAKEKAKIARHEILNDAVKAGCARWHNNDKGFQWIVRKHESMRQEFPEDFFVVTAEN